MWWLRINYICNGLLCVQWVQYIHGTNFQRLSMHAMTGRATRVRAAVVRYSHTKEVCVHKGKHNWKWSPIYVTISFKLQLCCMPTARWYVRLWVSCVVKLRQLTRFGEKFQLWLPNVWWLTTSNQHHENTSITVVVALLHCIACIHIHHFVESWVAR